jgi:hypothetical protein
MASALFSVGQTPQNRSDKLGQSDNSALVRTLGPARTFGQLGQLGQSRAERPNDESHPNQPMKMFFSSLFFEKIRFEGKTI